MLAAEHKIGHCLLIFIFGPSLPRPFLPCGPDGFPANAFLAYISEICGGRTMRLRFDKALSLNPGLAEAWQNKGSVLPDNGRLQEVLDCYDHAR